MQYTRAKINQSSHAKSSFGSDPKHQIAELVQLKAFNAF
jgi:hypothetical protein